MNTAEAGKAAFAPSWAYSYAPTVTGQPTVMAKAPALVSSFSASSANEGNDAFMRQAKLLGAGGFAGAIARTCSAPLDRIKLLMQVQALGENKAAYTGVGQALVKIAKEEGVLAYWKGNGTNIIRIFPYSAAQFAAHDTYKAALADENGKLTTVKRLVAGSCAGMTSTFLTHPLDTVRLRLAMPNSGYSSMTNAMTTMVKTEGPLSLYKGLFPTMVGIAPYAGANFLFYDSLNNFVFMDMGQAKTWWKTLLVGAASGTAATTICYPLDTIRRRMQMKGNRYANMYQAITQIYAQEGFINGYYQGWWANTVKVVPQNAIRFFCYEQFKTWFGVQKKATDT